MNEFQRRYLELLTAQAALKSSPSNVALAHSLLMIYMAFISFAEASPHFEIVTRVDKMNRNDIAHASVVPIPDGLIVRKVSESIKALGDSIAKI